MSIHYESIKGEISPHSIRADFRKRMYVVCSLPMIVELQRTFGEAFNNEQLDFKYYQTKAEPVQSEPKQAKTAVGQPDSKPIEPELHLSASLQCFFNAPVLIIPHDVFKESTLTLEINFGHFNISSELQPFDGQLDLNLVRDESLIYDKYNLFLKGFSIKLKDSELFGLREQHLIKDISYQIGIYNCHFQRHAVLPSVKVDICFSEQILIDLEL